MISSQELIKRIAEVGLPEQRLGNCRGIAIKGAHALIVEEMPVLISRLEMLGSFGDDDINEKITRARAKQKVFHEEVKQRLQKRWLASETIKPVSSTTTFEENLSPQQNAKYYFELSSAYAEADTKLSLEERSLLFSILPYFEAISVAQDTMRFRYLFGEKSTDNSTNLLCTPVLPRLLESKDNSPTIENSEKWDALYLKEELFTYFEILTQQLQQSTIRHPVAFILRNGRHGITVGWEPLEKVWRFISIDNLPAMKFKIPDSKTITDLVYKSMTIHIEFGESLISRFAGWVFKNSPVIFSTRMLNKLDDAVAVKRLIADCEKDLRWQNMHTVTFEKFRTVDSLGFRWLEIACYNENVKTVDKLLSLIAKRRYPVSGLQAALSTAVASENPVFVNKLLDAKADVNAVGIKTRPLLQAAASGSAQLVDLLLRRGADIHLCDPLGPGPLHAAVLGGSLISVKQLIDKKADINKSCFKTGVTPILIAIYQNQDDIFKYLLTKKNIELTLPIEISIDLYDKDLNKDLVVRLKKLVQDKGLKNNSFKNSNLLHFTMVFERVSMVKILLNSTFNFLQNIENNISIFEWANTIGNLAIIELLHRQFRYQAFSTTSQEFKFFGSQPTVNILSVVKEYMDGLPDDMRPDMRK